MAPEPDSDPNAADRFGLIAEWFERARVAESEAERAAVLEQIDDPDLRAEVEQLLSAHREGDEAFPEQLPEFLAEQMHEAIEDAAPDAMRSQSTVEGRWQTVHKLGSGGMGTVWLAKRVGADFEQQGALKVLRAGRDDPDLLRRFRAERSILARLEHRNIAKLLDGGTTEEGLPFVVMELVDGVDLLEHSRERDLDLRERVELFRRVCDAVEHAHAQLVVHRDLKPSNILVSKVDGEPKLLDFGIAKLLEEGQGADAARTMTGMLLLTPEYASPEQVRGGAGVSVATDVYALGLVLYELLTGVRAQRFDTVNSADLVRVVCEEDIAAPSVALQRESRGSGDTTARETTRATSRLRRRIAGDLDAIVLRALRKDPARRYRSVAELNEDLRRYLDGEAVQARRGTSTYRMSRFIGRHRIVLGAAVLVFGVSIAAAIVFAKQANELRTQRDELATQRDEITTQRDAVAEQRDLALREGTVTRETSRFLTGLFELPTQGAVRAEQMTARDLLDVGAQRIRSGLESGPLVRAALMRSMGDAYTALSLYDEADGLLEESYTLAEQSGDLAEIASSARLLGRLRRLQGDTAGGLEIEERALAALEAAPDSDLRRQEARRRLLMEYVEALLFVDRVADAEPILTALEAEMESSASPRERGALRSLRSTVLRLSGRYDEAEAIAREALAEAERRGRADERIAALFELSEVLRRDGRSSEALDCQRRLFEINRATFGEEHLFTDAARARLARMLARLARFDEAEDVLDGVVERARQRFGEHPFTATVIAVSGEVAEKRGRPREALPLFQEALAIQERVLPELHAEKASTLSSLGTCYSGLRQFEEAKSYHERAFAMYREIYGDESTDTISSRHSVAAMCAELDEHDRAQAEFEEVLKLRRKQLGDHPKTAATLYAMAVVAKDQGDRKKAEALGNESIEIYRRVLPGGTGLGIAYPLRLVARMMTMRGKAKDALPMLQEVMEIAKPLAPSDQLVTYSKRSLADCHAMIGEWDTAIALLSEVREALLAEFGQGHPAVRDIERHLQIVKDAAAKRR